MKVFDYIVIGAGSAGCAVAARLSEDPNTSVLLVEAGGSDRKLEVRAPVAFSKQFHTKGDWDYFSEPEPGCNGRRIYEPRGKVLGGCSSMNAMIWIRGHPSDYDSWGIDGWSWEECLPYFERAEHCHHLPDRAHGEHGPVHVTNNPKPDPLGELFIDAAAANDIPRNGDLSGPELEGTGVSPVTVWKGRRWSTARAYLGPAAKRPNLTVLTKALVRRIVVADGRAIGIDYERRGRRAAAAAASEVIVSAGAFNTPHLLQLSGIGSTDHLSQIGIRTLVESPGVGMNLMEHPLTLLNWELREPHRGLADAENPKYLLPWLINGSGPLSSNIPEALAHVRTLPELDAPDFQVLFAPIFFWEHGDGEHENPGMAIGLSYWTPRSRGTVKAMSNDPRQLPAVKLNLMTEREDVDAMIRAIKLARQIAATEPLAAVVGDEIHPGTSAQSDVELEAWIRRACEHTYHPSGTAKIGEPGDGVVDAELRVHGVEGLRVADTSVLPVITRANTNAPAIMVGERCADFIRQPTAAQSPSAAGASLASA